MTLKFTKMEGCGNDYVYINGIAQNVPTEMKPALVRKLSDRHFGIGGDGVIFINDSDKADFEMEMYNADGSRGEMCGNGIRCVGKYVYDHGLTDQKEITIESFGKVKYLTLYEDEKTGKIASARVNMGAPILEAAEIPVDMKESPVVDAPIEVAGKSYRMTCVSMGNPHAVVFVDHVDDYPLETVGPLFECHWRFPNKTNTEFVEVTDRSHIKMRVWERGAGETLACGTGCCASVVACVLNDKTDQHVSVQLLGGVIDIEYDREKNEIWMTGPATEVFEGQIEV